MPYGGRRTSPPPPPPDPVLHHNADHIFISFGIIGPIVISLKMEFCYVFARGRRQCCKLHYCLCRVSIKQRLPFSICYVFLVSKGNLFYFYFILLLYLYIVQGHDLQAQTTQGVTLYISTTSFCHLNHLV